jgi:hypothetical protein
MLANKNRTKQTGDPCTTCAKAIWDKRWGEYKCGYFHHRLHNPEDPKVCPGYEKLKKGQVVKNSDYEEDEE